MPQSWAGCRRRFIGEWQTDCRQISVTDPKIIAPEGARVEESGSDPYSFERREIGL